MRPSTNPPKEEESTNQQYRPTLSPFCKEEMTPRQERKNKTSTFETPQGFHYNLFESSSKTKTDTKKVQKDIVNDIVASLDFGNSSFDEPAKGDKGSNIFTTDSDSNTKLQKENCKPNQDLIKKQNTSILNDNVFAPPSVIEKVLAETNNLNKLDEFLQIRESNRYTTPLKGFHLQSDIQPRTCPKKVIAPGSLRKPLTEIKAPKAKSEADTGQAVSSRKHKLDFNNTLFMKTPARKEISVFSDCAYGQQSKPNQVSTKPLKQNQSDEGLGSGLTDLIQSINLIKENSPPKERRNSALQSNKDHKPKLSAEKLLGYENENKPEPENALFSKPIVNENPRMNPIKQEIKPASDNNTPVSYTHLTLPTICSV